MQHKLWHIPAPVSQQVVFFGKPAHQRGILTGCRATQAVIEVAQHQVVVAGVEQQVQQRHRVPPPGNTKQVTPLFGLRQKISMEGWAHAGETSNTSSLSSRPRTALYSWACHSDFL